MQRWRWWKTGLINTFHSFVSYECELHTNCVLCFCGDVIVTVTQTHRHTDTHTQSQIHNRCCCCPAVIAPIVAIVIACDYGIPRWALCGVIPLISLLFRFIFGLIVGRWMSLSRRLCNVHFTKCISGFYLRHTPCADISASNVLCVNLRWTHDAYTRAESTSTDYPTIKLIKKKFYSTDSYIFFCYLLTIEPKNFLHEMRIRGVRAGTGIQNHPRTVWSFTFSLSVSLPAPTRSVVLFRFLIKLMQHTFLSPHPRPHAGYLFIRIFNSFIKFTVGAFGRVAHIVRHSVQFVCRESEAKLQRNLCQALALAHTVRCPPSMLCVDFNFRMLGISTTTYAGIVGNDVDSHERVRRFDYVKLKSTAADWNARIINNNDNFVCMRQCAMGSARTRYSYSKSRSLKILWIIVCRSLRRWTFALSSRHLHAADVKLK